MVDEFTREALATAAARSFTADDTTILLDKIIAETGRRPANLRMDNGPELTAATMRDWCRFTDVATAFIVPGSPWQNGYSESFNGRFRDEFLTTEHFNTLLEAQVLAEDWRIQYNTTRPHGSLGGLTPTQFHQQWTNQPALPYPLDHQTGPGQSRPATPPPESTTWQARSHHGGIAADHPSAPDHV